MSFQRGSFRPEVMVGGEGAGCENSGKGAAFREQL